MGVTVVWFPVVGGWPVDGVAVAQTVGVGTSTEQFDAGESSLLA